MSLLFGALTSDRVNCGSGSSLDNLDPYSCMAWIYPTTNNPAGMIAVKGAVGTSSRRLWVAVADTSGNLQCVLNRLTTNLTYTSSNTPISTTNKWYCVAVTLNSTNSANNVVHIYVGDLTTPLAEVTYSATTDGSGAFRDDSAEDFIIGNNKGAATAFNGRIANVQYISTDLSLAKLIALQWKTQMTAQTKLLMHLGFNGTSTQPDSSGNGNSGTVTGATQAAHVPLARV